MVPERREEVTTEGGLDVLSNMDKIEKAIVKLDNVGTVCSLFIDPVKEQIDAAVKVGAPFVEFHTGRYANATNEKTIKEELKVLTEMASYADSVGLGVNSGHGLNYNNVAAIAAIPQMNELNIGHSIIARAIFTGLPEAVKTMKEIMEKARNNSQK